MRVLLLLAVLFPALGIYWTNPIATATKYPPTYVQTLKPFGDSVLLTAPQISLFDGARFSQGAFIVVAKGPAVVSAGITEGAVAVVAANYLATCSSLTYNSVAHFLCPEAAIVGTVTTSNWGASRAEPGTAGIVTPRVPIS